MPFTTAATLLSAASIAGCAPVPGLEARIADPKLDYLLVGEYHGTNEMPGLAADAMCAAAATGRPTVLGVEFTPDTQPFLDAYLASDGGQRARAALLEAPAWREKGGRTTMAILAMIERARLLAQAGRPVRIAAFDTVPQPTISQEREAGMAKGLAAAQAGRPGSLVVALTGAGHADKEGWVSRTPPITSAGGLLPQDRVLSITFARPGGQYWGCSAPDGDAARGCTSYAMPVREPVAARGIIWDPKLRGGFDGVYSVGSAYTASTPPDAAAAEGSSLQPTG